MFEVGQKVEVIDSQIFSVETGDIATITDITDSVITLDFEDSEYGTHLKQTIEVLFENIDLFDYASRFILPVGYVPTVEEEIVPEADTLEEIEAVEAEIIEPK